MVEEGATRRQFLRATSGALAGSAIGTTSVVPAIAQSDKDWSQRGYNAANTSYAPDINGPTADIKEQWRFGTPTDKVLKPTVANGTVYIGTESDDATLYAVYATDGSEQWRFDTPTDEVLKPTVANETVYIGTDSEDGTLYAVDATDGSEQWRFDTPTDWTVAAGASETLYVATGDGDSNIYAVDSDDGTERWRFAISDTSARPVPALGAVFVGTGDGNLYALTGSTTTETPEPGGGQGTPTEPAAAGGDQSDGASEGTSLLDDGWTTNAPLLLGLVGAGSAGAWWYSRRNGSGTGGDGSTGSGPTGGAVATSGGTTRSSSRSGSGASGDGRSTSSRSTKTGDGPGGSSSAASTPADDGLLESVTETLDAGDDHRDEADSHREAGWYDRALDAYDKAEDAYEDALATATKSDRKALLDTDDIEQKLTAVESARQETCHQQLQETVETIRDGLDRADTLAAAGNLDRAADRLDDLEFDIATARQTAATHDLHGLRDELSTLEGRRADRLTDVTEQVTTHPVPEVMPRSPDVAVEYEALTDREPIGGGGNADVTRAAVPTADGEVILAIKEPRMSGTLHTDQVERMLREAETWEKLDDHDHVVGVVDYGSTPMPWIAMEYMDGGHLGERGVAMDTTQALWTAIAITKGVRHAHQRGVAHLDLKPENILFRTVEDTWDVPKVADWGLSKHLLEHSKSVEGFSPQYAAPEQFDADEYGTPDNLTDIYQLGAVFYELFTGQPPVDGGPAQAMNQVLTKEPTPPSEVADVPDDLDAILLKTLAKEKSNRYEDILLLRNDIQDVFDTW